MDPGIEARPRPLPWSPLTRRRRQMRQVLMIVAMTAGWALFLAL